MTVRKGLSSYRQSLLPDRPRTCRSCRGNVAELSLAVRNVADPRPSTSTLPPLILCRRRFVSDSRATTPSSPSSLVITVTPHRPPHRPARYHRPLVGLGQMGGLVLSFTVRAPTCRAFLAARATVCLILPRCANDNPCAFCGALFLSRVGSSLVQ